MTFLCQYSPAFYLQTEPDIDFGNGKFTMTDETIGSLFTTLTLDVVSRSDHPARIDNFYLFTCEGGRKSILYRQSILVKTKSKFHANDTRFYHNNFTTTTTN